MSVTINAKGTSVPFFRLGKSGVTLYQGSANPSLSYTMANGDYWFDQSLNKLNVWSSTNTAWAAPRLADITFVNNEIAAFGGGDLVLRADGVNARVTIEGDVGPAIITSSASQDLYIDPSLGGGGNLILIDNKWPAADGTSGQVLITDGAGNLSFTTVTGTGTVTGMSVVSANGFAGSVATPTTTPAITVTTTVTGLLKGNGTAISSAIEGFDYSDGTASLATGILKSTNATGVLSIAVAGDFPTLNQDTTGTAAISTAAVITNDTTSAGTMYPVWAPAASGNQGLKVSSTKLSYVPSSGLLTTSALHTDYIDIDTVAVTTSAVGRLRWDTDAGTLQVGLAGGNVNLQIGQEEVQYVLNVTGSTIPNGTFVRVTGAQGNRKTVAPAQANSESGSVTILGMVTEDILNNQQGFCTVSGTVHDVDTFAFAEGSVIYLSPNVPGGYTDIKPQAPNHMVMLGYVVRSHATVGQIYVSIQNGYELDELHDVKITSVANGDMLQYDSTIPAWKNVSAVSISAGEAAQLSTARTISATGDATWSVSFDGSSDVSSAITLADVNSSPVTASFKKVTVNSKGLVTATSTVGLTDISTALGYTPVNIAGDTMSGALIHPLGTVSAPSISFTGDLNTGLWSPGADTVAFSTAGTERLRIDSSGNVGIGVIPSVWGSGRIGLQAVTASLVGVQGSPSYMELSSNRYIDSAGQDRYIGTAAAAVYQHALGSHKWYTAPSGTAEGAISFTQAMTLDASGNLGIGTSAPQGRLHIVESAAAALHLENPLTTGDGSHTVGIAAYKHATGYNKLLLDASSFSFRPIGTERVVIDTDGNIQQVTANRWIGNSGGACYVPDDGTFGGTIRNGGGFRITTAETERFRITAGGDVGVGTSTPESKFHVFSTVDIGITGETSGASSAASVILRAGNGTTSAKYAYARFVNNDTSAQDWRIGTYGTNNLTFHNSTAGNTALTIDTSGNVGIGVNGPTDRLDVNGTLRVRSDLNVYGSTTDRLLVAPAAAGSGVLVTGVNNSNTAYSGLTLDGSPVTINTAGTPRLTVTGSGDVGIGTSSPVSLGGSISTVDISGPSGGGLRFRTSAAGNSGYLLANSASIDLFTTDNLPMRFGTNDLERLRIDSSGNVGIGTSSPSSQLTVYGPDTTTVARFKSDSAMIRFRPYTGATYGTIIDASNAAETGYSPLLFVGSTLQLSSGSGTGIHIDGAGNVGVGTTPSPWWAGRKVVEIGGSGGNATFACSPGTSNYAGMMSNFYIDSSLTGRYVYNGAATAYEQGSGAHYWFSAASGTAGAPIAMNQAMTLTAAGQLAVGTATAYAKFTVKDGDVSLEMDTASTQASLLSYNRGTSAYATLGLRASDVRFMISDVEKMHIESNGDVAIGTTSAGNYRLRVAGGGNGLLIDQNGASGYNAVTASNDSGITAVFGVGGSTASGVFGNKAGTGTTTNHPFVFATNNTERMRIDASGNLLFGQTSVGITDSNGAGFTTGGVTFQNHASGTPSGVPYNVFGYGGSTIGNITQNGTTAVAYNTTSDYRLKNNPQALSGSGEFIDALKPKTWEWANDSTPGVGFIAHEVQEVSSSSVQGEKDAVDAEGKPVYQSMEYGSAEFIANIVAELQSLRARVAQLESKLG